MDFLRDDSPSARLFSRSLSGDAFTMLDVGCAGGIDAGWRVFGERLRAIGFDPSLQEIERLRAAEGHPGVRYVAGFVGVPPSHPAFAPATDHWKVNPWSRLSAARTQVLQKARREAAAAAVAHLEPGPEQAPQQADERALMGLNLWHETALASPAPIVLGAFLDEIAVDDVDFLKIDVDGDDFTILRSFETELTSRKVLGAVLEVSFHGSAHEHDHCFHNTDRLMRKAGFDLLGLSVRDYSLAALPQPFLFEHPFGAQTAGGRPLLGDALYLRDFGHVHADQRLADWSDDKLLKLAALYALFGRLDHAAELLNLAGDRLSAHLDIAQALDLLTAETQDCEPHLWSGRPFAAYRDYIEAYEADDPAFFAAARRRAEAEAAPQSQEPEIAPALQAHLDTARLERDRALAGLEAMRASTSWRLTAPLRALARRLGRP